MGLMGICGAGVLYEPAFTVIAAWFRHNRGTAMAVVTFVAGFASTIFVPLTDALLVTVGWRQAVLILGIILGVVTVPLHGLFLRRRPADLGLDVDGLAPEDEPIPSRSVDLGQVIRSRYFWVLTLAFALSTFSLYAVRFHFIPLMISVGIHPSSAAIASGAIGVMQVVGRVMLAPIERRVSSKTIAIGVFVLATVALATLMLGSSPPLIVLFVILFGMAIGTHTLSRPLIVADSYDTAYFGRINSAMVIFVTIAFTVAPFAAGVLFDLSGSYQPVLMLVTGLSAVTIVLIAVLPKQE
jgi:predicted MFS family arabinose efflux permease